MVFSKPRYPRYAIDLSHPAIRYAIAAAITVSGRYAATFPNNGPCLVGKARYFNSLRLVTQAISLKVTASFPRKKSVYYYEPRVGLSSLRICRHRPGPC